MKKVRSSVLFMVFTASITTIFWTIFQYGMMPKEIMRVVGFKPEGQIKADSIQGKTVQSLVMMGSDVSTGAVTEPGINSLKPSVVNFFLQKANTPSSQLYKRLESLNYRDGRNGDGIFPRPLKASDLQVVSITGENEYGWYCSRIEGQPGDRDCATKVSEAYLILVPSKQSVHKAVVYNSIQFFINASKLVEWKIYQIGTNQEKEYDRHESIEIGEPVQVCVQPRCDRDSFCSYSECPI